MNTEQKWSPDHSISKGYPYGAPVSRTIFPNANRLDPVRDAASGRIEISVSDVYKNIGDLGNDKQAMIDFIIHRLWDYHHVLVEAEAQIDDMQKEEPFIPEEFGFMQVHGPADISDSPVRVYSSKYDGTRSLYRKPGEDNIWVLITKTEEAFSTREQEINIPCHRIAYAAFYALGVKVEPTAAEMANEEEFDKLAAETATTEGGQDGN